METRMNASTCELIETLSKLDEWEIRISEKSRPRGRLPTCVVRYSYTKGTTSLKFHSATQVRKHLGLGSVQICQSCQVRRSVVGGTCISCSSPSPPGWPCRGGARAVVTWLRGQGWKVYERERPTRRGSVDRLFVRPGTKKQTKLRESSFRTMVAVKKFLCTQQTTVTKNDTLQYGGMADCRRRCCELDCDRFARYERGMGDMAGKTDGTARRMLCSRCLPKWIANRYRGEKEHWRTIVHHKHSTLARKDEFAATCNTLFESLGLVP
jgi:hypothetical protein